MSDTDEDALNSFLKAEGILHFTGSELLQMQRAGRKVPVPPKKWWPRILPTLRLADAIRVKVGCPLIVGNGYRPEPFNREVGGAYFSQHKTFRAVDLDLPQTYHSESMMRFFYRVAGEMYLSTQENMGLGLYAPWKGSRIHIDTGFRKRHWEKEYTVPLLLSLR